MNGDEKYPRGEGRIVVTRFITRNGKRIYHPRGGVYVFRVKGDKP